MRKKTLSIIATIVALVCVTVVSVTLILKKGEFSLSQEQRESIAYLKEKIALTPVQLTSVVSYIETESGFDPSLESSTGSFGLCQWSGNRYDNLKEFSKKAGSNISNLTLQLDFIIEELSPDSEYYALTDFGDYTVYDWINSDDVDDSVVLFRAIYSKLISEDSEVLDSQLEFAKKIYGYVKSQYTN